LQVAGRPPFLTDLCRDTECLGFANRFAAELWEGGRTTSQLSVVPFGAGPGICPGRWVVLLLTGAFIAGLIDGREVKIASQHTLGPDAPLPGTMDNYTLRFRVSPVA